ncbi:Mrp/NBP35 family ATP-binding protein [Thermospira aquatica]|uniref:Iron-sulfur cluster carrier protein n=1 Tax=Thermospira aquatica TaxID=2828656 RepID=A0AAX3BC25_9SPIR|nr:Mrp/NBP35 family ATP-binding protein [Thermospira aquatica]URA09648.1 Mrp/NBP35 family ATP-binding protein [Thermospira aquatica]
MEQPSSQKVDNKITHVIGVMSGKGGVGKSTVSYLLSLALKLRGYRVGILDADLTGASMPRLFQLKKKKIKTEGEFLIPFETQQGIKLVSMNLLLPEEDKPLIWRAPLLNQAIMQFWEKVIWGELDFLVVDLPPGTADVVLTVMQKIPLSGLVVVTTPHDMVSMIVSKSVSMAQAMEVPILGIVENMSGVICPHCGNTIDFFPRDEKLSDMITLAKIPLNTKLASISTKGLSVSDEEIQNLLTTLVENTLKRLEEVKE